MFRFWTPFVAVTLFSLVVHGQDAPNGALPAPAYKTTLDQASYGIGINIGQNLKADGLEINVDALAQGIKDVLANVKPRLDQAQIAAALQAFQQEMEAKSAERGKLIGEKNMREGKAFLATNKTKQGVVTLPSGLQYAVLQQGNGPSPKVTDTVRTHYHGTLLDGTVFDSSVERNEPATFPVGRVIRGWTEALQLMQVGSKWRLFVPSELAYGPQGAGADIGPHAVLVFDVELLGIE
ncbi:MAG: FKBP-type peptidyl-prolyl cis-trans isomerase [Planctomycetaceae bacterium]|nr:FKBP-type peptidyl-prolyl cis-trans isomerase [Planctomycetales bacterium]MCB9874006.1 FKBP-type peptidyl-prolyl cis-trans isomerase [Planctomycetaceae bacterium]MCB9941223.1 FKBP-type peptidyl-prolyl cis-trans isomerase [Planctomycetaceae bacterium]HRX77519.1 FKBP-type peptidyl-prolyl cis-trans isomerase [Pirellulaceae bacterium]